MVFDEAVLMGKQEQHDRTPAKIASELEFPCCSHYAERLAILEQVAILKVLVRPGRVLNHAELRLIRREASGLTTVGHTLLFNFCNNCLFVEVSNKEIFVFLNRVFKIFVNGGSMTKAKVYQGFTNMKRLKSTALKF